MSRGCVCRAGAATGVGKSCGGVCVVRLVGALCLRCVAMDPVCCGGRGDAELLLAASSGGAALDKVNPVWLRTPAAPFTAALIEDAKLDDAKVGHAEISERNANFIVVGPQAKSRDVLELIDLVRKGVAERMGVELELAVEVW